MVELEAVADLGILKGGEQAVGGGGGGGSGGHSPLGKIFKFMMFSMPFLP